MQVTPALGRSKQPRHAPRSLRQAPGSWEESGAIGRRQGADRCYRAPRRDPTQPGTVCQALCQAQSSRRFLLLSARPSRAASWRAEDRGRRPPSAVTPTSPLSSRCYFAATSRSNSPALNSAQRGGAPSDPKRWQVSQWPPVELYEYQGLGVLLLPKKSRERERGMEASGGAAIARIDRGG